MIFDATFQEEDSGFSAMGWMEREYIRIEVKRDGADLANLLLNIRLKRSTMGHAV